MRLILDLLVIGVSVHGGHQARFDSERFMQHLGYWAKQLVVQLAFETHLRSAVNLSQFTPMTQVKSAPSLAGALSTTFLQPASK